MEELPMKKPYEPPRLIILGDIKDITQLGTIEDGEYRWGVSG